MSPRKRGVYFTLEALDDIRDSLLFAAREWDLDAAHFYRELLDDTLDSSAEFPEWNQKKDDVQDGIETSGMGHHMIYVRTYEDAVHVIRMLHYRLNETHYWDVM